MGPEYDGMFSCIAVKLYVPSIIEIWIIVGNTRTF
jgi:hypothetical protein